MTCRHFGSCGGCTLQQLSYPEQLVHKGAAVTALFGPTPCVIAADSPWRYRSKMEFSFGYVKGLLTLGLYKKRGIIEDLEECPISPDWFTEAMAAARAWGRSFNLTSYYPPRDRGHLRTLTLRETAGGRMAILTVSGHPDYTLSQEAKEALKEALPGLSLFICTQVLEKKAPTRFLLEHLAGSSTIEEKLTVMLPDGTSKTFSFFLEPLAFLQPHVRQAEKLYAKALALAAIQPHETVLDLYSGMATLSHFAATQAQQVIAIELNPDAVKSARFNASHNNVKNLTIIEGDASLMPGQADIVIVDPPRSGLGEKTIAALLAMRPQRILYISCNPQTQKTDCESLVGYTIKDVAPVDQFPQTLHIENIVLLCAS
jgi:23S rRNA (uracil1939-C5)-methyltransferase